MAAFAAQQQSVNVAVRGNLINCWFVLDNSGSMSGQKWNLARAGILNCIGQLTNSDFMGIILFGDKIKVAAIGARANIDLGEFSRASADGGGTALYDAIIQAGVLSRELHAKIHGMASQQGVNCITYMIVLTDGEDNKSQSKPHQVKEILEALNRTRGFKIILAGVGLNGQASSIMRSFGNVGDNDIEFRELRGMGDIKDLFEHVTIQLQATRTTLVAGEGGVVAVKEVTAFNLSDGTMQSGTAVQGHLFNGGGVGGGTGRQQPLLTYPSAGAPQSDKVKVVPSSVDEFWNPQYDLNDYERKALAGVCCLQPCCVCCCVPGTVDHLCCRYPSYGVGNCLTGECCLGTLCCVLPLPSVLLLPCYPLIVCNKCSSGERYE